MMNSKLFYFSVTLVLIIITSCSKEKTEVLPSNWVKKKEKIVSQMGLQLINENLETRSEIECQDENIDFCDGPYSVTYVVDYQGCPVTVTSEIYICPDINTGGTYFVTGENFSFNYPWFTDPECGAIFGQILSLWLLQDIEGLNDFLDALYYDLEVAWESQFVNQFMLNNPSQSYYCDLPQLDANIVVENYKGTCYRRCFNYTQKDGLSWQDLRCGFGCCTRKSTYCIDRVSGEIISTTSVEVIEECNFEPEPYPGCQYLSECTESCSKIN